jgi:metallo-beta-lactamase family protein
MHLQFIGAAQTVTGSKHLLECRGHRILIDCGLHQERQLMERNWDRFPVPPSSIDAVVLTHGHLDHCGWLPRLVMQGFSGPVFATAPTADVVPIILADSARLQVEDAENKRKRHQRDGRQQEHGYRPLYDEDDAERACRLLKPCAFDAPIAVCPGITITFRRAGHIIGAANVLAECVEGALRRRVLFSGDLGVMNRPLMPDPEPAPACDAVVVESTYGDRLHQTGGDIQAQLADIVNDTVKRGGNLVIPAFAIERTQEVLWRLHQLHVARRIPPLTVMVDSPMAIKVTQVFKRHPDALDAEARALFADDGSPYSFHGVRMLATREQSQTANHIRGGAIIIAGSGMCTGGRIKHHLDHNLERPESTILFVGYQASGTLGRQLVEGARQVRLFGRFRDVRARVVQVHGFSGHADRDAITAWLGAITPRPSRIYVVHGGPNVATSFANHLKDKIGVEAVVPAYLEQHAL